MDTIVEKLDQLGELSAQEDWLRIKKQEMIDSVLTPEIKQQLSDIDAETAPEFEAITEKKKELEANIKDSVIRIGESVKGAVYHAVWSKGRVSWNDNGLMQYLSVHPEIAYLREVGNPSVSIRKVG